MGNFHSRGHAPSTYVYSGRGNSAVGDLLCLGVLTAGCCFFSDSSTVRGLSTAGLVLGVLLLAAGIVGLATSIFSGLGLGLLLVGLVLAAVGGAYLGKSCESPSPKF